MTVDELIKVLQDERDTTLDGKVIVSIEDGMEELPLLVEIDYVQDGIINVTI